jgi:GTP pyrophosphokinase
MGYKLQNGDQIQVYTNKNQKPSEDWLKMVVTGKARAKIRSATKEERRIRGEFGKEAMQRKLKNLKVDYEDSIEFLLKHFTYPSRVDFFYDIAIDKISIPEIFREVHAEAGKLVVTEMAPNPIPAAAPDIQKTRNRASKKTGEKPRLMINGEPAERFEYSFASCCNPVQGDQIFAYLTANAGLKIHRSNCPNAANLMANYGYRVMKADWVMTTNSTFVADLKITGIDDGPGIIEKLSHQISSALNLNIRSFSIEGYEGYFEGRISLLVANTDQLNLAIRSLQNLDHVSTVSRVE